MEQAEYMKVQYKHLPPDIKAKYKLHDKVTSNQYIYIHIKKGMYGLKQAAILAYNHLQRCLKQHGYTPVTGTVGVWKYHKEN